MLVIADEVREALGPEVLKTVERENPEYRCAVCGVDGNAAAEPTSLLVMVHSDGGQRISMGHSTCIESQVLESDRPLADQTLVDEEEDVRSLAGLIPAGGKMRPWLFIHRRLALKAVTTGGDRIDPWVDALMSQGWQIATGLKTKMHPPRHGWKLELDERDRGRVVNDEGWVLVDRMPPLPDGWANLARRSGAIQILAGDLGFTQKTSGVVALDQMASACVAGQVAGAWLKVVRSSPRSLGAASEDQRVRRELAETLEQALRTRPDRNASDHLNTAPEVVPLATRPTLRPFMIPQGDGQPDFPIVLVDLMDDDAERARDTLKAFVKRGMVADRNLGETMFPLPPEGWSHLTWSSQILIFAGRDKDGQTRKVLFEPCSFPKHWLDAVGATMLGGIGLAVTNLCGEPLSADVLTAKSAAGELVVCAIPGMLAGQPGKPRS